MGGYEMWIEYFLKTNQPKKKLLLLRFVVASVLVLLCLENLSMSLVSGSGLSQCSDRNICAANLHPVKIFTP